MWVITKKIITVCAFTSLFILPLNEAKAFEVEPKAQDIWITTQNEQEVFIEITNTSSEEREYTFQLRKVELEEGVVKTVSNPTAQEVRAVQLPKSIRLQPAEQKKLGIQFSLTQTSSATEVFGIEIKETPVSGEQLAVHTAILSLVFLSSEPAQHSESFEIIQSKLTKPKRSHQPFLLELEISNTDRGIIQPSGDIEIKNIFKNTIAAAKINQSERRILPGETRTFLVEVDAGNANLFFGKYTTVLQVRSWPLGEETMREFVVWIFGKNILIAGGIMLAILLGILLLRRSVR